MEAKKRKTTKPVKKPAAKKPKLVKKPIKAAVRKVVRTTKRKPVVAASTVSTTLTPPLVVSPTLSTLKPSRRSGPTPWSIRHNLVTVISLTVCAVIAFAMIGGFTQVTLMQIEALNGSTSSLLKPTAVETRFVSTPAGEMAIGLPATWSVTATADAGITYTHTTVADAVVQVSLVSNETDNVFTWLQTQTTDYANAVVIESADNVKAWRGVTVSARDANEIPLTIYYIPIQKNLGERYVLAIRATVPVGAETEVKKGLDTLLSNLEVN